MWRSLAFALSMFLSFLLLTPMAQAQAQTVPLSATTTRVEMGTKLEWLKDEGGPAQHFRCRRIGRLQAPGGRTQPGLHSGGDLVACGGSAHPFRTQSLVIGGHQPAA
jgi:hypothetical protein